MWRDGNLQRDERHDEGPPTKSGVLNVVAILEHRPLGIQHENWCHTTRIRIGFSNTHNAKRKANLCYLDPSLVIANNNEEGF